ncbi:MAG: hypothetical protein ABJB04_08765 [Betaproteobacteria bacterium]
MTLEQTVGGSTVGGVSSAGNTSGIAQAAALRHALLDLHHALIEHERRAYEKLHGRQSGAEFLQLLAYDPAYQWLSPLSGMIVALDEAEDNADDDTAAAAATGGEPKNDAVHAVAARTVALLRRDSDPAEPFSLRYSPLIDVSPEIALAHARAISAARAAG